jgi:hypothetical protein
VPNDIGTEKYFIPTEILRTQNCLNENQSWTENRKMKANTSKSKYMTINFTRIYQFNNRLYLENKLLEQVQKTRLLGLEINES